MQGEGDTSGSTLDDFKVRQYCMHLPRGLLLKEGIESKRQGDNFKVQKLFADVQICSKSRLRLDGAQMLLTESLSQPRGCRMTKTLTGVFRVAAAVCPSPAGTYTISGLCKHEAKTKWLPFSGCPNARQTLETQRGLCTN